MFIFSKESCCLELHRHGIAALLILKRKMLQLPLVSCETQNNPHCTTVPQSPPCPLTPHVSPPKLLGSALLFCGKRARRDSCYFVSYCLFSYSPAVYPRDSCRFPFPGSFLEGKFLSFKIMNLLRLGRAFVLHVVGAGCTWG